MISRRLPAGQVVAAQPVRGTVWLGLQRFAAALVVVAAGVGCEPRSGGVEAGSQAQDAAAPVPDTAGLELTEGALYRVSARPVDGDPPVGQLHAWVVHVETADGELFAPSHLALDGGMPGHGHGLVTRPRATRALGDGDFLVEGMKFHMPGDWVLKIEVVGPHGPDVATLDLRVMP